MRNRTPVVFLAGALALSAGNAAAVPYTFTNLYDTSGPFGEFRTTPSLNNSGTVAFFAILDTGERGVFTGSGGPTTTIADEGGRFIELPPSSPSLNESGAVAFSARLSTGETGIFTGSGGPTTTLYDSSGPFRFFNLSGFNNSGTVAFFAERDTLEAGIFTGSGGPTTTIADSSGPLSRFGARPALNDNGTVAFHAELGPDNPGIFTGSGGPTTTIADSSGPFAAFGTFPSLNNSGTVAFVGGLDGFGGFGGIFTGSGGPITTIADSSGPFGLFPSFAPSLNDSGTVAFFAELDTGGAGIFTGPDPLADEVISIGDTLFGSTVTDIFIQSDSLNDTGQLAFLYGLTDGRRGIARADPQVTPAPEPGTLPLLVAGLLGAVLWRKGKST